MATPHPYVTAGVNAGLPTALAGYMPRYVHIESGGNPNARSGSYTGLLQMGPDERAKYGGNGIDNGARMYADKYNAFVQKHGRDPSPTELYLANQQGAGGLAAHMANPTAPAWQNMASTAEGRAKGDAWARQAIWGNVPDTMKANYPGGVDSLTSQQFMDLWKQKVEQGQPFNPVAAQQPATPAWSPVGTSDPTGAQAQGAPGSGLLGGAMAMQQPTPDTGMLANALTGMGLPQPMQGQSFGMYAGDAIRNALGMQPAQPQQPGQQQNDMSGGYMPQMPQPQQLQAPPINYFRPQMAGGQMPTMPQFGPLRF